MSRWGILLVATLQPNTWIPPRTETIHLVGQPARPEQIWKLAETLPSRHAAHGNGVEQLKAISKSELCRVVNLSVCDFWVCPAPPTLSILVLCNMSGALCCEFLNLAAFLSWSAKPATPRLTKTNACQTDDGYALKIDSKHDDTVSLSCDSTNTDTCQVIARTSSLWTSCTMALICI